MVVHALPDAPPDNIPRILALGVTRVQLAREELTDLRFSDWREAASGLAALRDDITQKVTVSAVDLGVQ
jgi:predicted DNA-binding protein (UPF0251 family)